MDTNRHEWGILTEGNEERCYSRLASRTLHSCRRATQNSPRFHLAGCDGELEAVRGRTAFQSSRPQLNILNSSTSQLNIAAFFKAAMSILSISIIALMTRPALALSESPRS